MEFLRIILFTIGIVVVTNSFEMSYYKWETTKLLPVMGKPFLRFTTDLSTACAAACRLFTDCLLYLQDGSTCQLFDNMTLLEFDPTKSSGLVVGRDRSRMPPTVIEGPLTNDRFRGDEGTFWSFFFCDAYTYVNSIKVWSDYYDGPLRNLTDDEDDQGITKIEMICSSKDGVVANSLIQGNDVDGTTAYEYTCSPGSFIYSIQGKREAPKEVDDYIGIFGVGVQCHGLEYSTTWVARGDGFAYRGYQKTNWQSCPGGYYVCGLSLKVLEDNTGDNSTDNTAVNEMRTMCCYYEEIQ